MTGTGLGLFGVRTRAEGLQGTCGARHNPSSPTGTGTVMWFAIPYTEDKTVPSPVSVQVLNALNLNLIATVPASPPARASVKMKPVPTPTASTPSGSSPLTQLIRSHRLTAMVVDDTLTIRKLMERMLLQMGFESVVCYENGAKGLDAMMAAPVDIVFSDVQMPIMTGPEVNIASRMWLLLLLF